MAHIPQLIKDLALILGAAGITTLLFKWLKQPVVLGYIIAGLLVGPNFSLFPTISDIEGIRIWADIGVVFLLFALGLEFSFKKLVRVGGSAAITGTFEIACMFGLGYMAGKMFGWSVMDRIFLGGIIAISSTTIIFRAFEELDLKAKKFTALVLGILVIEDLIAILMLVLLSTLAVTKGFEGKEMLFSIAKLGFLLSLWFLSGIFLVPSFFKKIARWLTNETLLIVALALCLGMVVLADNVGFSAALGAFIMGSILSETSQAEKIEHLVAPVKNLFGAIFFVSVGMLINPSLLVEYAVPVIILTLMVIMGKTIFVSTGALLAGQPLQQAVQAGTSMTQIGEFSFIIAALGLSLKVTSDYLYPIAVGVSVITTFTTPYMMKLANPLYGFLGKILPEKWVKSLDRYSTGIQTIQGESDWKKVLHSYIQLILTNSVIIVALILLSTYYITPFFIDQFNNPLLAKILASFITLSAMTPFLWALTIKKMRGTAYAALWLDKKYNRGPLLMLEVTRNVIAVFFLGFLLRQMFSLAIALWGSLIVMPVVLYIFSQRLEKFYERIQTRFLHNLNQKEIEKAKPSQLSPWDAHLAVFDISPYAGYVGKSLEELAWREQYGVNIAFIERGEKIIYAPSRYEKLYPHDNIGVIATDRQLQQLMPVLEMKSEEQFEENKDHIGLMKIVVDEHNRLKGLSIRSSAIREKAKGLIVGIERNNERILNPSSNTVFEWNDVVWIVGNKKMIKENYLRE